MAGVAVPFRRLVVTLSLIAASVSLLDAQTDYWEPARGQFRDPVTALAVGPNGTLLAGTGSSNGGGALYRSTDHGSAWTQLPLSVSATTVRAIFVDSTGRILVGAAEGQGGAGVYLSDDAGAHWTASALTGGTYAFCAAPGALLAATTQGIYRSADGGMTWHSTGFMRPAYALALDSTGALLAGTTGYTTYMQSGATSPSSTVSAHAGIVYRSVDTGESWQEVYSISGTASGLLAPAPQMVFAAMGNQGVGRSTDAGLTWNAFNAGLGSDLAINCLACEGSGALLAGTADGLLYRLPAGASTWMQVSSASGTKESLLALVADGGAILAGTTDINGFLARSTDLGATWSYPEGSLAARWVITLRPTRDNTLIAGTLDGIFTTTDEGSTWHRAAGEAGAASVYDLQELQDGTMVAAAGYAGVFMSGDQGRTWARTASLPASYYSGLAVTPSGAFFVGGSGQVRRSTDRGATWSTLPVSGDFLFGSRSGMVFSRDSLGSLQRSADDGASWIPAAGIDPENTLYAMAEDSTGLLYAGAYEGLYTSVDSGASWKKILGQETWCLAVNAAGYLFRGDYGGTELDGAGLSKNGGLSWHDLTSGLGGHDGITSYAILPSGRIFAGTADGSVFRSAVSSLPVLLSGFTGISSPGQGVTVTWATLEENSLLGFWVERSLNAAGPYLQLNGSYKPALGQTGTTNVYSYMDSSAAPGVLYYYRLRQVGGDSDISFSRDCQVTTLNSVAESTPLQFSLEQNYPNPFNPSTAVRYTLARAGVVHLEVFNALGQRVASLVEGAESAGVHEVRFDATNLASGMYLYRISAGSFTATKRMLLVK